MRSAPASRPSSAARGARVPDATGLELLAQELGAQPSRHSTPCTSAARATLEVAPGAIRAVLAALREQGLRLPVLACTASTTTPRSRAWASPTSCSTWSASIASRSSCASRTDAPEVESVTPGLADRRPPGARGL